MSVNLKVVGCSPAWPNPGGAQSGYLLEGPGRLLLDCGPGILARMREQNGWPEVDAIAITHFHLDHWGDLVPWVWGSMYLQGRGDAPQRARWRVEPGLRQFGPAHAAEPQDHALEVDPLPGALVRPSRLGDREPDRRRDCQGGRECRRQR